MVKVLLLNNSLFDGQKVVSIEHEPNIVLGLYPILHPKENNSKEIGSGFLVATKDGNLKIYSIANSEAHQSGSISEEPIHLEPFSINKQKIQTAEENDSSSSEKSSGNVILAAEYLPPPINV